MKKLLKVLLAFMMCLSLTACGGVGNDEGKIYLEEVYENQYYLNFPSQKSFESRLKKVEITKENWSDYFEDYSYTEHVVNKNAFGDVDNEYDSIYVGFGLKRNICGLVSGKLAFKFDGYVSYSSSPLRNGKTEEATYSIFKLHESTYKTYNYETNELIKETETEVVDDYYYLEFDNSESKNYIQLGDANVLDVVGYLYVIDLPEGLYNGEDIIQVNFGGGGTGFGSGNLSMFYKE